ncbi:MAG: cell division protein ZapE [Porticoccaceae bacterium]
MTEALSPELAYQRAVAQDGFVPDEAQQRALQALQSCYQALHGDASASARGVYLWGPVGRGKTWLMDCFYDGLRVPARRQHFHHFMQWVHRRLFALTGTANPLQILAQELASEVRVLCFDELFVADIADAMLLGRLFQMMFEAGVVMVATSNQAPDHLYAEGFNRERFLPAIATLKQHMIVVAVDGGRDYRLRPGQPHQRYWVREPSQPSALAGIFRQLTGDALESDEPLLLGGRVAKALRHSAGAVWFRFADLCERPFSVADFIELCDRFPAVLLGDVPRLDGNERPARIARGTEDAAERVVTGDRDLPPLSRHDDSVRRFIALVDECYDRGVPLYIEAAVSMHALYPAGYLSFPFRRTLSRLQEMQLERFPCGR